MYLYWMVYPSIMMRVQGVTVVAAFVSIIIATNYGLTPLANVKLEDLLVFVAAFVFGLRIGITVAVLSETLWGIMSPYGFGGAIIPFLVIGELLYAVAGSGLSHILKERIEPFSSTNVLMGSLLAACAFIFDVETNAATAFLVFGGGTTLRTLLDYEFLGIPFMIPHELSDFVLGSLVASPIIYYARRLGARKEVYHLGKRVEAGI